MKTQLPPEANVEIQATISMEEMEMAVRQGKSAKAPGHFGFSHDFLKHIRKTIGHDLLQIVKDMYVGEAILDSQKHGVIVCVPKKRQPERPGEYRALTLLNAEFKLLSRKLASTLKKCTKVLLHSSQHCGIFDNNIYGALAAIRETTAHVEMKNSPTCLLTFDFAETFDKIAYMYLFKVLEHCGFIPNFLTRLKKMYTNATPSVQVNGHISLPIHIHSGIRQGCSLSMLLFTICINPFLCMLVRCYKRTTTLWEEEHTTLTHIQTMLRSFCTLQTPCQKSEVP